MYKLYMVCKPAGPGNIKKRVMLYSLFFYFILICPAYIYAQDGISPAKDRLFHLERSKNRNLVCYDANIVDGKLVEKNPLNIYWLNREESPGETKNLTVIQKKLAYGYKLLSQDENSCEVSLSAYSGRNLTIKKQNDKYVCVIIINNEPAILHSLYVKAKESNSLSVEYVELRGISVKTQETVSERILK